MRLTLVISSLERGGAERMMSIVASAWAEQGNQVTLLSWDHGDAPAYDLHPAVNLKHLALLGGSRNVFAGLWRNTKRIKVLRCAVRDSTPEIVVSLLEKTNILTIFATRFMRVPLVIGEQIDPALYDVGRIWSFLRRHTYRFSDALVCPTAHSAEKFQAITGVTPVIIPNAVAVPPAPARERLNRKCSDRLLVGMGRLVHQKGFDLLLEAFSMIAGKHPDWKLSILGGGPLLSELQEQARSLNLAHRVTFPGAVSDPFDRLRSADLFVFSSRFEGFGMALAEAMACGLPVVSFDCPEGPGEIVRDGVDGVLVPPENVRALATALDGLMSNDVERQRLAANAPEVLERFGQKRIMALWQEVFDGLLRHNPGANKATRSTHD